MSIVTIIGAGMMGTALCWPLTDNGHQVRLAGTPLDEDIIERIRLDGVHPRHERKIPDGVQLYNHGQIEQALEGASLVISGVSSFGVDWLATEVGPHLNPNVALLSVTKGLEDLPDGSLEIIPAALERKLPDSLRGKISLNAIGGPCIAQELAARRHTCVVFCGKDPAVLENLRSMLATSYYHIRTSTDMVGVEVCAALKNGFASGICLAAGQLETLGADGIAQMYNPQAALFAQSCVEMGRLTRLLGGGDENVAWLPGAGDLYVTIFGGRSRRLGILLGRGISFEDARRELAGLTLESAEIITRTARALPLLEKRGLLKTADFPLLMHLDGVINHDAKVNIPWEAFR